MLGGSIQQRHHSTSITNACWRPSQNLLGRVTNNNNDNNDSLSLPLEMEGREEGGDEDVPPPTEAEDLVLGDAEEAPPDAHNTVFEPDDRPLVPIRACRR